MNVVGAKQAYEQGMDTKCEVEIKGMARGFKPGERKESDERFAHVSHVQSFL